MVGKRITICVMSLALICGMCGCVFDNTQAADPADNQIVLKWVTGGLEEQKDSAKVWKKFNEELQKYMPGVVVEFECY